MKYRYMRQAIRLIYNYYLRNFKFFLTFEEQVANLGEIADFFTA